jgi:hypothetical protein
MEFLFKEDKLCEANCYMCKMLVSKTYKGGLMGHFEISKTLDVLHKHFISLI